MQSLLLNAMCGGSTGQAGPYIGGFQDLVAPDYSEPAGGWRWVDGSPFPGSAVISLDDNLGHQDYLHFISLQPSCGGPFVLDDVGLVSNANRSFVVEWSADCNHDGIVDYGQCHDGTLADYNGNNIPDCCERGTPCIANLVLNGSFESIPLAADCSWIPISASSNSEITPWIVTASSVDDCRWSASCPSNLGWRPFAGEHSIDLNGAAPFGAIAQRVATIVGQNYEFRFAMTGNCYHGGERSVEVAIAGTTHVFVHVCTGASEQPWTEHSFVFQAVSSDSDLVIRSISDTGWWGPVIDSVTIEPYTPALPTCRDADLFRDGIINGADLGILLAQWGQANAGTVSDIDHDGRVDGSDLGTLLSYWGPCSP